MLYCAVSSHILMSYVTLSSNMWHCHVTCHTLMTHVTLSSNMWQVSAALDHNVDTLLVGVVRQIRLSSPESLAKTMAGYEV